MTDTPTIAALRAALARLDSVPPIGNMMSLEQRESSARTSTSASLGFITVAANPEIVRSVLAELDRLRAENEKLRAQLEQPR